MSATAAPPGAGGLVGDVASILRLHIIGIAVAAALTFGWLFSGEYMVGVALLGGLDWLLINLFNKTTDIAEDLANRIRGTERVAGHRRAFLGGALALLVVSFALSHLVYPELTPLRALVQLIGLGYSFAIVPTPKGMRRFKDLYFLKNTMSAVLFVLTVFVYTATVGGGAPGLPGGLWGALLLALFFVPFELTYEVLYDLRDLEGDREAGVPTYPVVHGPERARQIIDALLVVSTLPLLAGLAGGLLGVREALMLAAPAVQLAFYRPRYRRGLTSRDCIQLTNLGTALLLFYLVGTRVWLALGLPANIVVA